MKTFRLGAGLTAVRLLRFTMLTLISFAGWLLLAQDVSSGLSLVSGILLSGAAAWFSYRIFFERDVFHRSDIFLRFDLLLLYLLTVFIQSYLASFELIWRILSGRHRPGIIRIRTSLRSPLGRIILANSITLIPGTLSLWLDDDHLYVHWFDQKTVNSLKAGRMIKGRLEQLLMRITG